MTSTPRSLRIFHRACLASKVKHMLIRGPVTVWTGSDRVSISYLMFWWSCGSLVLYNDAKPHGFYRLRPQAIQAPSARKSSLIVNEHWIFEKFSRFGPGCSVVGKANSHGRVGRYDVVIPSKRHCQPVSRRTLPAYKGSLSDNTTQLNFSNLYRVSSF